MKLKLKYAIRNNGTRHLPPAVIDTEVLGLKDADIAMLLRSGTAVRCDEAAEASAPAPAAAGAPEVIDLGLGKTEQEGTLAGVVDEDGKVKTLAEMTKAELVEIAKDMGIEGPASLKKADLIASIEVQKVHIPADVAGALADDPADGAQEGDKDPEDAGQE